MANPPRSPSKLNSSRNRALDIGTERSGFPDGIPYDGAAGVPTEHAGGKHVPNVKHDGSAWPTPDARPADPKPFK